MHKPRLWYAPYSDTLFISDENGVVWFYSEAKKDWTRAHIFRTALLCAKMADTYSWEEVPLD